MADQKDYEWINRNGDHYMITHQNGVPRYNKIVRPAEPQPDMLGSGAAADAAKKLQDAGKRQAAAEAAQGV